MSRTRTGTWPSLPRVFRRDCHRYVPFGLQGGLPFRTARSPGFGVQSQVVPLYTPAVVMLARLGQRLAATLNAERQYHVAKFDAS